MYMSADTHIWSISLTHRKVKKFKFSRTPWASSITSLISSSYPSSSLYSNTKRTTKKKRRRRNRKREAPTTAKIRRRKIAVNGKQSQKIPALNKMAKILERNTENMQISTAQQCCAIFIRLEESLSSPSLLSLSLFSLLHINIRSD